MRADFGGLTSRSSSGRSASIRRPTFRSAASLIRGPTSCRLVTGTVLSFTGIGIAKRRISCKIHGNGVLQTNTRASKRAILPEGRNRWGQILKSRQSDEINFFEDLVKSVLPLRSPLRALPVLGRI